MTEASAAIDSADSPRKKSFWFVALGVIVFAAGMIAAANYLVATVISVLFIGAMMIAGGMIEIIHAFGVKTWGSFFLWLLTGILYMVAGILTFYDPLLASAIITLMIAASLVAAGVVRLYVGLTQRHSTGWGWVVASGVVTLIVGILIMLRWPVNSLWLLGIFLAVDLMFQGLSYIFYGLGLKRSPSQV